MGIFCVCETSEIIIVFREDSIKDRLGKCQKNVSTVFIQTLITTNIVTFHTMRVTVFLYISQPSCPRIFFIFAKIIIDGFFE